MSQPIPLGPFRGVNNIDARNSSVFQLPLSPEVPSPFLRAAINVDLDRQGWPRKRQGRVKVMELTDGHSGFAFQDVVYFVNGTDLVAVEKKDWANPVTLYQGLVPSARVSFCEVGGEIFWCNGAQRGRIVGTQAFEWGMSRPGITHLGQTAGPLRPGRYMVAVTAETASGQESGAFGAVIIDLTEGAMVVNLAPCSYPFVNIYVSDPDGSSLFWARRVSTDQFPVIVNETSVSTDLLDSIAYGPPPLGHIVREFRGRLLVALGNVLYFSSPISPHLFRLGTDFQMFDSRILMLEPLTEGFYIATETVTYWVEGAEPAEWRPRVVDKRKVAEGPGLRLSGRKVEGLNAETVYRRVQQPAAEVVIWMTQDGPAFGMSSGQVQLLFDGVVAMEQAERAALGFREIGGLRQVLMSLQQPTENHFAATDRISVSIMRGATAVESTLVSDQATATVIKAGEG